MRSTNDLPQLQLMALDAAANAILITDAAGVILWVNPAFTRLTGFTPEETIGRTPSLLKSGAQDPHVYEELWVTIQAGRVWRGRLVNRSKDGRLYVEEQTITPVLAHDGRITHFIAVKQDQTAYEAIQERLQQRDDIFRLLLENALDIITIVNLDGTIRYESPSVRQILGYDPEELQGRSVFDFMPEDDAAKALSILQDLADRPGGTASLEARFRHKDGSWRTFEAVGRNMLDHPVLTGILVNSRDVTDRKRIEEELTCQRDARIQSDKLADMGTLLAGVAHELNNPLTVVTGYSGILRQALGDGPLAARVDKIAIAAQRCVRIVRNFLALARHSPPERQQVRLNQVVREAVELLAYPLRVDDVDVHLDLADDLPALWADAHQLHQAIVNLITNAHHAMHGSESTRRLTIRTRYEALGSRVRLDVADTGPGIPAQVLARIFEPFFTTKPVGQGTGLGLPLCQGIIEGHGGTIRVDSKPGHGATFLIELPVVPGPPGEAGDASGSIRMLPPGRRILIVDDEPDVAGVLGDLLKADGEEIETVPDGRAALEKIQAGAYDLILCDVRMPRLDGPGLYRALEQSNPKLLPRFVFLTGDTLNPESWDSSSERGRPASTSPSISTRSDASSVAPCSRIADATPLSSRCSFLFQNRQVHELRDGTDLLLRTGDVAIEAGDRPVEERSSNFRNSLHKTHAARSRFLSTSRTLNHRID
jgi:nitrogen fixation negative regulator NifL